MTDVNQLRNNILATLQDVGTNITEAGLNFAAREPVWIVRYGYADTGNPYDRGDQTVLNPNDEKLIVFDMKIGQIWKFTEIVGDAFIKIPQGTHTRDQLLGKSLEDNQEQFYRIGGDNISTGGELYTVINGGVKDEKGLFWDITLKRADQ